MLRILLAQPTIPGNEIRYMQSIYAVVMLIPFLHIIAVQATVRRIRFWRRSTQLPTQMQVVRYIASPFIWNAAIAYVLLVTLPMAFEADISTVILFQPDVGWVAVVSGVFAIVWGVVSTSIGISMLRQTVKRPEIV